MGENCSEFPFDEMESLEGEQNRGYVRTETAGANETAVGEDCEVRVAEAYVGDDATEDEGVRGNGGLAGVGTADPREVSAGGVGFGGAHGTLVLAVLV